MSDEWQLPVPKEDPEARPASIDGEGGGGGCPFPMPDVNIVDDENGDDGDVAGSMIREVRQDR